MINQVGLFDGFATEKCHHQRRPALPVIEAKR
jgi:hypothetical protein